MASDGSLELRG
ncbi:predicted protein [Fibroporia radiculosa]|uniref:Uncharacterized protein n=1 Tax=Fibroporia radiculosa TaxID=599839 RepID=J7RVM3_9APHY|nr:predicted protein [Fibroporia radiculosa]